MSKNNRLEFDLGWRDIRDGNAIKAVALYQRVWNIDSAFNWYAGGGGIANWDYDYDGHSGTSVFVVGDIWYRIQI